MTDTYTPYENYTIEECYECNSPPPIIPVHIPHTYKGSEYYSAYGCFCNIQCAREYLTKHCIDDSVMFEQFASLQYEYKIGVIPRKPKFFMTSRDVFETIELDSVPTYKIRMKSDAKNKRSMFENFFKK